MVCFTNIWLSPQVPPPPNIFLGVTNSMLTRRWNKHFKKFISVFTNLKDSLCKKLQNIHDWCKNKVVSYILLFFQCPRYAWNVRVEVMFIATNVLNRMWRLLFQSSFPFWGRGRKVQIPLLFLYQRSLIK